MFHKEGSKIIFISLLISVGLIFLADAFFKDSVWLLKTVQIIVLIFLFLILQFFRNQTRVADNSDNHILAPVDGKVVVIEEVY